LQAGFMVSGGAGLQQGNLPFYDFQLPLRFHCWIQKSSWLLASSFWRKPCSLSF
jgi:hypothetical protein